MKALARGLCFAFVAAVTLGCADDQHRDIRTHLHVIDTRTDALADRSHAALVRHGQVALTEIEARLHGAKLETRSRLLAIVGEIKHPDSIELLKHWTIHDVDEEIRDQGKNTLALWASKDDALAGLARAALKAIPRHQIPAVDGAPPAPTP